MYSNLQPLPYDMNLQQQYYAQVQMHLQHMQMQHLYPGVPRQPATTFGNYAATGNLQKLGPPIIPRTANATSHLRPHGQELLKGVVRTLRRDKGFGFIACSTTLSEFHRDVFLEKDEIANLQVGMGVEFLLFINEKNQPVGKLVPPHGIFTGTLKVYNNLRGYGFVECADSTRIYGTDVFIQKKEVELYSAKVGDQMEFTIFLNMHNQPQATITQIFRGTIVTRGNFHFISCRETKRKFSQDVFLVKSIAKDFNVHDEVDFTVIINDKGQPQAHSVTAVTEAPVQPQIDADDTVYEGTVKSLGTRYGFVGSEAATVKYCSDIFLLVTPNLANSLSVGDTIQFKVQMNEKKQPQAVQPRLLQKHATSSNFRDSGKKRFSKSK